MRRTAVQPEWKTGADADDETVNHKVDGGGGTDRSQCIDTEKFSNNDRIDHAVKLLEQKSHQHRTAKPRISFAGLPFVISFMVERCEERLMEKPSFLKNDYKTLRVDFIRNT